MDLGPTLLQYDLVSIRPHSQDSGGHEILGDIIQFRTFSFLFLISVCVVFTKNNTGEGLRVGQQSVEFKSQLTTYWLSHPGQVA